MKGTTIEREIKAPIVDRISYHNVGVVRAREYDDPTLAEYHEKRLAIYVAMYEAIQNGLDELKALK